MAGGEYERLLGVFSLRLRVARMRLGDEQIDLMQFLAPPGAGRFPWTRAATTTGSSTSVIVVSSADKSLAFYRDSLGLEVVGETRRGNLQAVRRPLPIP